MLRSVSRLLPLALTLSLFACVDGERIAGPEDQDQGSTGKVGTGKGFTLLLTDAPGDFEAAVVTISGINLKGPGQPVELLEEPLTVDLLELRNEVATVVSGLDLPEGSYSELRLVIDGAYIEVETESGTKVYASSSSYEGLPDDLEVDGTLQMPSMGQSGLKIKLPDGKVEIGEGETIVMLDFDVEESFGHEAGKSGKWIMHPVIKATNVTFGGFVTARLQLGPGVTLPVLNGDTITLGDFTALLVSASGDTIRVPLADTDDDGVYEAMYKGVAPGTYQLSLLAPAGVIVSFGQTFPIAVTVAEKQTSTQVISITSLALPAKVVATLTQDTATLKTLPTGVELTQFKARLTPTGSSTSAEVAFTDANNDKVFEAEFPNRAPGTYTVAVIAPTGVTATYEPATSPTVTVGTAGATVTQAFLLKTAVKTP